MSMLSLTFLNHVSRDDSSYENPLKEIFSLVCGIEPLTQIFVDLLPEKFTQRIFVSGSSYPVSPVFCYLVSRKLKTISSAASTRKSKIKPRAKYTTPTSRSFLKTTTKTSLSRSSKKSLVNCCRATPRCSSFYRFSFLRSMSPLLNTSCLDLWLKLRFLITTLRFHPCSQPVNRLNQSVVGQPGEMRRKVPRFSKMPRLSPFWSGRLLRL